MLYQLIKGDIASFCSSINFYVYKIDGFIEFYRAYLYLKDNKTPATINQKIQTLENISKILQKIQTELENI